MEDEKPTGLDRDDSEQIGFVTECLMCAAIDLRELRAWCVQIIERYPIEAIPEYLFELVDFDGPLAKIYRVIGFVPVWEHDERDIASLYGIAAQRGRERYEWPVPPDVAKEKLRRNRKIQKRFASTFPFISFDCD
jgi:hypothetical protein